VICIGSARLDGDEAMLEGRGGALDDVHELGALGDLDTLA
jgi:hypothetical protein